MKSLRKLLFASFSLTLPLWLIGSPENGPAEGGGTTHAGDSAGSAGLTGRALFSADRLTCDPVAFCFAPGTDPAVMAYYEALMHTDPENTRYHLNGRWSGAQGSPRALTWSFVPDGLSVDGGTSELFSRLDAQFAAQGGRATWIARFQACFDRWAALTGTSYTRITFGGNDWDDNASWGSVGSANHGDVRIAMILIDGASGTLAYNYYPSNGDMVLDRAESSWSSQSNSNRFLRDVVMHEHGHGLGLRHVCSTNSSQLMEPIINTSFDGPQDDDLRGGQRHYGDPHELNDMIGTAANLGTVDLGLPIVLGAVPAPNINFASILTLDADGDNDYYRFTVTGARSATVVITPVGRTYDNSPQECAGNPSSCCTGNPVNSLTIADLNMELIAPDASTVIASATAQPAGSSETISNAFLGAGDHYVRVFEANAPAEAQYYTLSISVTDLDCNANGLDDPCDVDCGPPGGECDLPGCGLAADCNSNGLPDECEDCNANGSADACDIAGGTSLDCNDDNVPDECGLVDCNANTTPDECDIALGTSPDCNGSGVPDECEVAAGSSLDCNATGTPDECEIFGNDCNGNSTPDECDIASVASQDCNLDATPDECEVTANRAYDCNANGFLDSCDLATGTSGDCNSNGLPDECESESCLALWDGFEPDPPFTPGTFINGLDYNGDGNAWQNPGNTTSYGTQGCPASTGKAVKTVAQTPSPTDFFPLTSEYFRTVGGLLPTGSPMWSLSFDARSEASLNPRIDWQLAVKDGTTNGNVIVIHWASTQSAFTGVSASQKGRILVQNPAGSPAFLSSNFAIPANNCYSIQVVFDSIEDSVQLYINGTLRVTTMALQTSARRMDFFKLEQRGNNQAVGGTNRLALDNFQVCQTGAELAPGGAPDCNLNNVWDECDLASGTSVDANTNGTPDECEAGAPAATVTGAVSRKNCDLTLLPPRKSEPRSGGITEVRIAFDVPPGGPGPNPVTLEQATCAAPAFAPYSGSSVLGAGIAANELVLTFTPGLENARTYRMGIGPNVTSLAGQSVEVRGLVGDATDDGLVNAGDRSAVVGVWTGSGVSCDTDINQSGQTDAGDRSAVVGAWTGVQNCAP